VGQYQKEVRGWPHTLRRTRKSRKPRPTKDKPGKAEGNSQGSNEGGKGEGRRKDKSSTPVGLIMSVGVHSPILS
jgi:hypothetical protein